MTIIKRNRLIRSIASTLAERAGHEAEHDAALDDRSTELGLRAAYEDAARNLYAHLTDRRVYRGRHCVTGEQVIRLRLGLPALQQMLATEVRS